MADFGKWIHAKERGGFVKMPHEPGESWEFVPFLFNPFEYVEEDTQNYEKKQIPMWADPVLQYTGGGGATLKFDVFLEQERIKEFFAYDKIGSLFEQPDNALGSNSKAVLAIADAALTADIRFGSSMTVDDYIAKIESLKAPKQARSTGEAGDFFAMGPPRVMVVFGKFWKMGFISRTQITYTELYTDGQTRSAEIQVQMLLSHGRMNEYRRRADLFDRKAGFPAIGRK